MGLIRTGIGISKTIKNVGRLKEIISIFARNGFDEFIIKLGVHDKIPHFVLPKSKLKKIKEDDRQSFDWGQVIGARLAKVFSELGPTFIKLGQLLSTREDLFDAPFVNEMKLLLDSAPVIPFKESLELIEKSFGRKPSEIFKKIHEKPIGSASIGVVYKAELLSGEQVVIKIKRPKIERIIETDLAILDFLVSKMEKSFEELRYIGLRRIIHDFSNNIKNELDFNLEILNGEKLKSVITRLDPESIFYLPKIFSDYSNDNIIVMEYLDGIPFSDTTKIMPFKDELEKMFLEGISIFTKSLLNEGIFHADLHGGNFFLLKNGKIGIIDFGLVGNLSKKGRRGLVAILYLLVNFNYENLVYEFLDIADYEKVPDVPLLVNDVRESLSPYIGLKFQKINFSKMTSSIIKVLSSHQIYLPRDWFIIFRALVTLEGVGRSLKFDFDLFQLLKKNVGDIFSIKDLFSKEELLEELTFSSKDIVSLSKSVPQHLKWFLKDFAKKNYSWQVTQQGYEKEIRFLGNSIIFLGHLIVSAVFVFMGFWETKDVHFQSFRDVPIITVVFWVMAFFIYLKGKGYIKKFLKKWPF